MTNFVSIALAVQRSCSRETRGGAVSAPPTPPPPQAVAAGYHIPRRVSMRKTAEVGARQTRNKTDKVAQGGPRVNRSDGLSDSRENRGSWLGLVFVCLFIYYFFAINIGKYA